MKKILFLLFLLFVTKTNGQQILQVGKNVKSVFAKKEILESNLGSDGGYSRPVYFKLDNDDEWQKAGFLCSKLKPYLYTNGKAKREYQIYKKKTITSQLLIVPTTVSLVAYNFTALNNIANGKSKSLLGAYFRPNTLAWLAVYFASFNGSIYLKKNAEMHLFQAVQLKNGRITSGISEHGVGIWYVFH